MSHHWLYDGANSLDPDDEEEDFDAGDHGCKHCDARGEFCPDCEGNGSWDSGGTREDGTPIEIGCSRCNCEGVIQLTDREIYEAHRAAATAETHRRQVEWLEKFMAMPGTNRPVQNPRSPAVGVTSYILDLEERLRESYKVVEHLLGGFRMLPGAPLSTAQALRNDAERRAIAYLENSPPMEGEVEYADKQAD